MATNPFSGLTHVPALQPHLAQAGRVFRTFAEQDSGCVSYGVAAAGRRWFVKSASTPGGVSSLRRAIAVHQAVAHPAIAPLLHSFTTDDGLVLVYPWFTGARQGVP